MWAGNTFGNLFKQRFLDFDKLSRFDDIKYLLDLAQEHDLLLGAGLGPELEQPLDDLLGEGGVLLQELDHAVSQLGVVEAEAADFVKGDEDFAEELLVLQLQWKGEAVDDATKDLE